MDIIDQYKLLTKYQTDLLQENAAKPYRFGFKDENTRYLSLDDILCSLGVDVIIADKVEHTYWCSYFDKAKNYWDEQVKKLEGVEPGSLELEKARNNLKRVEEEKKNLALYSFPLGEYSREKNTITLYIGRMREFGNGHWTNHYLISTFAHEVMHAYFDRPGCKQYPYAPFVEEPLAEFGMLLYLNATRFDYLNWAIDNVKSHETIYRYGWDLYQQFLDGFTGLLSHLETYKSEIGEYDMLDVAGQRDPKQSKNMSISFPMPMDKNGLKIVRGINDLYGITDRSGRMIVETVFEMIELRESGYIATDCGMEIPLDNIINKRII